MARRAGAPPSPRRAATGRSYGGGHWLLAGSEQRLGAGGRRGLVDDPPVAEEHHPVGPRRQLGVVGDDHAGHPSLARGPDQPHDRLAVGRVEGARGLVGQQQVAVADDGSGDGDPLAFAAGQLVGEAGGPVAQPELLQGGASPPPGPPCAGMPSSSRGRDTFSAAVSPASRLKSWNT